MLGTQMMDFLALENWSELFQGNGRGQGRNLRNQQKCWKGRERNGYRCELRTVQGQGGQEL